MILENIKAELSDLHKTGKLERIDLKFGFRMDIYRKNGRAFLEAFNRDKCFCVTKATDDNSDFENKILELKSILENGKKI